MTAFAQRLQRVLNFFKPENLEKQTIHYESDTALIVIDVQKEFCAQPDVIDWLILNIRRGNQETQEVSARIQSLAPEFRKAGVPVYVVYFDLGGKPHFHKFKPERGDTVVAKNKNSAFVDSDLKDILTEDRRKNLLLCGFNLNACVLETAIDGVAEGFNVTVLGELCGNDTPNCAPDKYTAQEIFDQLRINGVTVAEDTTAVLKKIAQGKLAP